MLLSISRCAGVFLPNTLKPSVLSLTECHSCQEPIYGNSAASAPGRGPRRASRDRTTARAHARFGSGPSTGPTRPARPSARAAWRRQDRDEEVARSLIGMARDGGPEPIAFPPGTLAATRAWVAPLECAVSRSQARPERIPDGQRVVRLVACESREVSPTLATQMQPELRRMAPK